MIEPATLVPPFADFVNNLLAAFFDTPLLRIQQLLQTQDVNPALQHVPKIHGAIDCTKRIFRSEGVLYYWRSYIPLAVSYCLREVSESIHLLNYTEKKTTPKENNPTDVQTPDPIDNPSDPNLKRNPLSEPGVPLSLFIAGWGIIQHPIDVIQLRLACNFMGKFLGESARMSTSFVDLIKTGGIKGLYRGYVPLTLYSLLDKNLFTPLFDKLDTTSPIMFKGAMLLRDFILYPLFVVSSRLMIQPGNSLANYNGMIECFQSTYKSSGIRGFYKGFQITAAIYGFSVLTTTIQTLYDPSNTQ